MYIMTQSKLINEVIKPKMNDLNITSYKISKEIGCSKSTVTRWLNGESDIKLVTFLEISRVLKIKVF